MVPSGPDDRGRLLLENWDKYFGHLDFLRPSISEDGGVSCDWDLSNLSAEDAKNGSEAIKAYYRACMNGSVKPAQASSYNPPPYKTWQSPTTKEEHMKIWEDLKEINCEYSAYGEQNKTWYANFFARQNMVQSLIDNAKLSIKGVSIEDLLAKYSIN
jgi:hypothetical protein